MPIYEYQCEQCGKHFEKFQKILDDPLTECKFCHGKLHKLISECAFHLKGTGWYTTDYKKPVDSVGKRVERKEEGTESTKESKTETKTETSPSAATETKSAD